MGYVIVAYEVDDFNLSEMVIFMLIMGKIIDATIVDSIKDWGNKLLISRSQGRIWLRADKNNTFEKLLIVVENIEDVVDVGSMDLSVVV